MKKLATIILIVLILGGCSSTKYAFDQSVYGYKGSYDYNSKNVKLVESGGELASADDWIRRNLW